MSFEVVSKDAWESYQEIPPVIQDRERLLLVQNVAGFMPSYRQEIADAIEVLPVLTGQKDEIIADEESAMRFEFYAWNAQDESFELSDLQNNLQQTSHMSEFLGSYIFHSRASMRDWNDVIEFPGVTPLLRFMFNQGKIDGTLKLGPLDNLDARFIKLEKDSDKRLIVEDQLTDPYPPYSQKIMTKLVNSVTVWEAAEILDQAYDNASRREFFWRAVLESVANTKEQSIVRTIGRRAVLALDQATKDRYRIK